MNIASLAPTNEQPDYAAEVMGRLSKDYAILLETVADVLSRLRALPPTIEDENTLSAYASIVTEGRDLRKRLEVYHDHEKSPYLRGGQGCDQFFFGAIDKLGRRNPKNPAGGLDIADARVDDFMQRKLAAERAKRAAEAAEAARILREAEEKAAAERRAAQEAIEAAARARKPENVEAHREAAAGHAIAAQEATAAVTVAAERAEDARIDTLASAADLTRTRLDSGALATMGQVPFVQIVDVTKLDMAALWPHLKEEHILMALKAWAKVKSHKTPMAGAVIEMRNKGRIG
jgi:hypothetical protein